MIASEPQRVVIASDDHEFVGRIFDLSVVWISIDSLKELHSFDDLAYLLPIDQRLTALTRRIESLNRIGDLIWLDERFRCERGLPTDRHTWLTFCLDSFLMRYTSIFDALLLLARDVLEVRLTDKECSLGNLRKRVQSHTLISELQKYRNKVQSIHDERNESFHAALERSHTSAPETFRFAALMEHRGNPISGTDENNQPIDVSSYFNEGLVDLQLTFNEYLTNLSEHLKVIYDILAPEFERRFHIKFNDPVKGYGHKSRRRR